VSQIDRNAIANAHLNDLEEDLGLVGTQYNTCISILFVDIVRRVSYSAVKLTKKRQKEPHTKREIAIS
jgi:hypothetical protein